MQKDGVQIEEKEIKDQGLSGLDFSIELPEADDDQFKPIPKSQYIEEYEAEVIRYMRTTPDLPKNDILYSHVKIPKDLPGPAYREWCLEEIRRCKEGWNGLCGKMYFFFNYCYIQGNQKRILPHFRVIHNEWFKFVEACQASNGWGVICVKRRRIGASWMEAADMVHDCLFRTNFNIGMNSKSERDSILLFNKVKFIYDGLPDFLRVPIGSDTKNFFDFSYYVKDANGKSIRKGNMSTIIAVAPTDNAYEGMLLSKWISDESGKVDNLATMWQYTEDTLMDNTRRTGIPILFGTAGDISGNGRDMEYMWRNSNDYRLKRFFFAGWMGLTSDNDDYGNDNKEEGIRWIVYERHRREKLRQSEYNTFLQKYPLTVAEAFTVTTDAGVGNIVKIRSQQASLIENPVKKSIGWFKLGKDGRVQFVPDAKGKAVIYEHPDKTKDSLYVSGADPADHDDTFKEASDLSMYILKRPQGTDPLRVVFEYTDRPSDVTDYYEQAAYALMYYNDCKMLIERNRYGMIKHFKNNGYYHLMARTPRSLVRVVGGREQLLGLQTTPATKIYMKDLVAKYIEDYYEFIPSYELLEEFLYVGARNTDRYMAFGIAMVYAEDKIDMQITEYKEIDRRAPHFRYKMIGGKITRMN